MKTWKRTAAWLGLIVLMGYGLWDMVKLAVREAVGFAFGLSLGGLGGA